MKIMFSLEETTNNYMLKLEQSFVSKLKKWMLYNLDGMTYGWEVKYPRSKNYIFKSDKSFAKELRNLHIWYKKFIYKFSDIAQMGTPHDGFTATGRAYFFFTWNGKRFYMIECTEIQRLIDIGIPSIDEKMASVICYLSDEVK